MNKINLRILYLSFHNSLKKIYGVNHLVRTRDIKIKLGRQFLVPKNLRNFVIEELIDMKLLEKVDDECVKILDADLNIENQNEFYKKIGIY